MSAVENCEPLAKRQRTEDASLSSATRHDTHWYRDGSIVLHVEDMLFRVHQTTLEKFSEVFRDLFAVPQPEGEEQVDGCPVVRLQADKSLHWEHLLDAIYDPLHFFTLESQNRNDKIARLSSILRLATKYRIVVFRQKCITMFSKHFPTADVFACNLHDLPSIPQAADVLQLGRTTNALTLLPFAFLRLALIPNKEILYYLQIAKEDKLALYRGLLELLTARNKDVYPFVFAFTPTDGCRASPSCTIRGFGDLPASVDNIHFFALKAEFAFMQTVLCESCYESIGSTFLAGRQKTWERLPEIFDLGKDWDELRRIQNYDSELPP
ncbi:hypothetical protein BD626DRAFT_624817 [Schizophyllum amplum]|uniref:BTB domain-containing protein n=1 Tax=Schizophyllum amplum TaxID=97359 RepID=A0A550CXD4_9AGAR|nr:hypothetical protein BD626DRAFT_624817 [Auriculariopsis ampla]